VNVRHVNLRLDEKTWERARQAAEADRRSLTNWITVLVEKAIEDKPCEPAGQPAQPALFHPRRA
jgi:hypothetical protein